MKDSNNKKLTILFVFSYPMRIGGGFKSALAFVKHLIEFGHKIIIFSPGGSSEMIKNFEGIGAILENDEKFFKTSPFPVIKGYEKILNLIEKYNVDIIDAKEYLGIGRSHLAAILTKKIFVFTEPGGNFLYHVPPSKVNVVVFSKEQIESLFKYYPYLNKSNINLIRARIDLNDYRPNLYNKNIIDKYKLEDKGIKVFMAVRLAIQKGVLLKSVLDAADYLIKNNIDIKIIVAGDGPYYNKLIQDAKNINNINLDNPILFFIGPILDSNELIDFYNFSDILVGSGRGILEGMACSKPAIILGENGEAELVNGKNIENVAFHNFSGRHFRKYKKKSSSLKEVLTELYLNQDLIQETGKFSYNYINDQMNSRDGASKLEKVYFDSYTKEQSTLKDFIIWVLKAIFYKIIMIKPQLKRVWINFYGRRSK